MRRDNNNDPIQENNPLRLGIDNLLEDDSYNLLDDDFEEYNDLHDCSDDLSDRGSAREAIEHEKFANQKRAKLQFVQTLSNANPNAFKNFEKYKNYTKKDFENMQKAKSVKYIVIFFVIIVCLSQFGIVIQEMFKVFNDATSHLPENDYSYYEEQTARKQQAFETAKQNILIAPRFLENGKMLLEIKNNNDTSYTNVNIQAIFHGENDEVAKIVDVYADNLFANGTNFYEVYSFPINYTNVEFLISKDYWDDDEIEINKDDVTAYMVDNVNAFRLTVENNTYEDIDTVEVLVLYYRDNELVDFTKSTVYDLDSREKEEKNIYKSRYTESYDSVRYFVNSIVRD